MPREDVRASVRSETSLPPHQQKASYPVAQIARRNEEVRRPVPPQKDTMPPKEETKKPFAEAFKNIEKEIVSKNPTPAPIPVPSVPLATLTEKKMPAVVRPPAPILKNALTQKDTSALKSALADVLKEHKEKKVVEIPAPQREEASVEIKKEEPVISEAEIRTEPPRHTTPPIETPHEETKIREVPEDVLTAILQGED